MNRRYLGPPMAAPKPKPCHLCGSTEVGGPLPGRTRGELKEFGDVIWPTFRACACGAICETVYPMIEFSLQQLEKGDSE